MGNKAALEKLRVAALPPCNRINKGGEATSGFSSVVTYFFSSYLELQQRELQQRGTHGCDAFWLHLGVAAAGAARRYMCRCLLLL